MAAILMRNGDNGQLEMEGTIGNELVIQPVPPQLTKYDEEFVDDEMFLDEDEDRDATPYLERNRLRPPNADAVDAAGALTDMGKYLYREHRLPTYDLAVVITKLDMCRRRFPGGRCNRGTAGFAYVGGACVVNKRLEKVNSVAIIEDSGGFSGIIVAAHEIGHLLGCVHDGSPPPSYLGGPGATHCPWEDGFIMSDLRHTERGFKWSSCSVEQFKHFLNGETATCYSTFLTKMTCWFESCQEPCCPWMNNAKETEEQQPALKMQEFVLSFSVLILLPDIACHIDLLQKVLYAVMVRSAKTVDVWQKSKI
ncbi:Metalloprotease mig-17 like protein [Argiope bruennichi]|uniref:Metalloprotease mig-17 like protein n=1 Tax=Argiope bruennichi TaxID=94029 RepID=A0A8T0FTM2_ARGBR|nr:Metalloprotease mig-17 like protein [Argiope bruennichi]